MAPTPLQHRRTHNTLLFQKLLNQRDGASPFTLIFDTLEQGSGQVVREFIRRAKVSKYKVIYLSVGGVRPASKRQEVDHYINGQRQHLSTLREQVVNYITSLPSSQRCSIIIDSLNPIAAKEPAHLATFLSSLIISPAVALIATFHQDIPTPKTAEYAPDPITLLDFLATTVLRLQNLSQVLKRKRARDRSHQEPVFGLSEQREGVLLSLPTGPKESGIVVEMELRRKSGRGILESFILTPAASGPGQVALLDDHPVFVTPSFEPEDKTEDESTFSMGLTEKQKRDREGVVLPYFDAQKDGGASGPGDGGRILYEMGEEDKEDFDDEEDEV